jgi:hypothetical protein
MFDGTQGIDMSIEIELKNIFIVGKKKSTLSEFLISHENSKWPNGPLPGKK